MTDFKDRTAGLIVFGAVQILFGIGALCFIFSFAAASELQSRQGIPPPPRAAIVTNIVMYAILACYFFSAGIGSIRRRRWARALSVVVSALWLALGIMSIIFLGVLMPHIKQILPPSQGSLMFAILFCTLAVIYVVIPGVLFLFYRSAHVKATVDAHDQKIRWTDRVPLPVLALVLLMAFSAVATLAALGYNVVPLFGTILTGASATIVLIAFAGLFGFLAVQFYRLKRSAWWTLVLLQFIGLLTGIATVSMTDFDKMYEQMGFMTPQVRAMNLTHIYREPVVWFAMGMVWVAFLAWILSLRTYFDATPPRTRADDVPSPS